MVKLKISKTYPFSINEVFAAIDHINALSRIKPDLKNYRIVRDEEGLQLIDVAVRFLITRFPLRLKYTTVPMKYCELKMLKGNIRGYEYNYTIEKKDSGAMLTVDCSIKLSLGHLIVQPLIKAIVKSRINKELKRIEKILNT